MASTEKLIAVARGKEKGDILLRGARIVNVFSGEIVDGDVLICEDTIAAVVNKETERKELQAAKIVDLDGAFLLPGLIDAHIHVESSMLTPAGFARAALSHGTTAVICDPHEIVNVAGLAGLDFMLRSSRSSPVDFFFMIPSCVPATKMETAGAELDMARIEKAFEMFPEAPGLAEMMNYPGLLEAEEEVLIKIAFARQRGYLVDGHAPFLSGRDLNAYIGAGISSDHECTSAQEALEKVRLGMKVIIREGSAAQDLRALLPAVNEKNFTEFMFGCDDRHPADLLRFGEIDDILRKAVRLGLDPVTAVRMATINTARHYRLKDRGGIAPGLKADLVVVEDLQDFRVREVYKNGKAVFKGGKLRGEFTQHRDPRLEESVRLADLKNKFTLKPPAPQAEANVIVVKGGQIITGWEKLPFSGISVKDDILKVAVAERFNKEGRVAVGLVRGFGLKRGALASTVAHDSHNLIVVGTSDKDMEAAARALSQAGGGLVAVDEGKVCALLPLPVGGLMSYEDAFRVAELHHEVEAAAYNLGCTLPSPFMALSFLALPVVPELKITDRGLVDVKNFKFAEIFSARK